MKIPSSHGSQAIHKNEVITRATGNPHDRIAQSNRTINENPDNRQDSFTITGAVEDSKDIIKRTIYSMSELKKKAESARSLKPSEPTDNRIDGLEPLVERNLGASREELILLARERVQSGYYKREDVLEALADRILEGL